MKLEYPILYGHKYTCPIAGRILKKKYPLGNELSPVRDIRRDSLQRARFVRSSAEKISSLRRCCDRDDRAIRLCRPFQVGIIGTGRKTTMLRVTKKKKKKSRKLE